MDVTIRQATVDDAQGVVDLCEEIGVKWRASDPETVDAWKEWAVEGGF